MKTLIILLSLLLTTNLYCFDTVKIIPSLKGVKVWEQGTKIYQNLNLTDYSGRLVIKVQELPENIKQDNISISPARGVNVMTLQLLDQEELNQQTRSISGLKSALKDLRDSLKLLDWKEKEQISLKKQLFIQADDPKQLNRIQLLFKEESKSLRKERLGVLRRLQHMQEKLNAFSPQLGQLNQLSQNLYLSLQIESWADENLEIVYFVPKQKRENSQISANSHEVEKYTLVGRVIESEQRFPLVFAKIEYFHDKELLGTTYTDEDGFFEIALPQAGPYTVVIEQEGYRNRKLKRLSLAPNWDNQRTISLKAKDPISAVEILSFALPVLDLVQSNW
ncbi:MAG: carboxypeptidase regulatory-like domain-containing protein [Vicingaceae bacterium]